MAAYIWYGSRLKTLYETNSAFLKFLKQYVKEIFQSRANIPELVFWTALQVSVFSTEVEFRIDNPQSFHFCSTVFPWYPWLVLLQFVKKLAQRIFHAFEALLRLGYICTSTCYATDCGVFRSAHNAHLTIHILPRAPLQILSVAPVIPDPGEKSGSSFQPGSFKPYYQNSHFVILFNQKVTQTKRIFLIRVKCY